MLCFIWDKCHLLLKRSCDHHMFFSHKITLRLFVNSVPGLYTCECACNTYIGSNPQNFTRLSYHIRSFSQSWWHLKLTDDSLESNCGFQMLSDNLAKFCKYHLRWTSIHDNNWPTTWSTRQHRKPAIQVMLLGHRLYLQTVCGHPDWSVDCLLQRLSDSLSKCSQRAVTLPT